MPKKEGFKPGDMVSVTTSQKRHEGVVMPSPDPQNLVLKLRSGYNLVLKKKTIQEVKKEKTPPVQEKPQLPKMQPKPGLKTIGILHTGGTIASQVDYTTGAVSAKFTPEEIVAMYPDLGKSANIKSRLISNMFSEDMRFSHYNALAKEIKKEVDAGVDGIIITHGTDTMCHTAAALAFMLEQLPIPIILVGSQRSSDRGSADAPLNLLSAVHIITKTEFADVGVCMHESSSDEACVLLPATKTRKLHSSRRDAFKPVNASPIARIFKDGKITFLTEHYRKAAKEQQQKLTLKLLKEDLKIGMLKIHPHMYVKEFENYSSFNGLIIEGTGLGHAPINVIDKYTKEHANILKAIEKLAKKIPVVMTTQTLFGRVTMNVYSPGRVLKEKGILGDYLDLLPETAFIKLAWVLSNYPKNQVAAIMHENLRGEITKRSVHEEFL